MDLVVTVCWWTWQLYNFGKVNTKVMTCQTVKRNRWRDHQCHYGQLSWYWDEEWVTCRWYPCTLCISIKAQMTTMYGDGSTPILRNGCESYLQMCRIKGALLISRYTAGQDWHGCTNLLLWGGARQQDIRCVIIPTLQLCNYDGIRSQCPWSTLFICSYAWYM